MKVLVLQLDGKIPNLALLKVAAWERAQGNEVVFREAGTLETLEPLAWDPKWDRVYASAVFSKSRPLAERVRALYPEAILGGTGWDLRVKLEDAGISDSTRPDYSDFPAFTASLGFTHRGCPRECDFCVVPRKEGKPKSVATAADIWRGDPWPRRLLLLDNNFFGQVEWRERVAEILSGGFEVSINQGIDLRALTEAQAAALASMKYRSQDFKSKRIYAAWDGTEDEAKVIRGIGRLVAAGVEPRALMIYVLIGFRTEEADWLYRFERLAALGVLVYPMPFVRTPETLGFKRWVEMGYWRAMTWDEWKRDGYQAHAQRRRNARAAQPKLWDADPDASVDAASSCPYCRDTGCAYDPQTAEGPRCPSCTEAA